MPDSAPSSLVGVTVNLVYLARLREAFGRSGERLTLQAASSTVAELVAELRARGDPWSRELASGRAFRVAVNHEVAGSDVALRDGDEVAFLPPVTGG
jgi:molybdopterin synthase sulfur carrier subunit